MREVSPEPKDKRENLMTKLFVGNLPFSMNEQELQETFSQGGLTIQSVRIVLDRATQRPRGFAFVELPDEQVEAFIKEWNTRPLQGRPVHVEKAQDRASSPRPIGHNGPRTSSFGDRPAPRSTYRPDGPFRPNPGFQRAYPMDPPAPNFDRGQKRHTKSPASPDKRNKEKRPATKREERERGKWRWDGNTDY